MKKSKYFMILLGILFISFNLRAPITAVGSVVEMIQSGYGLSNASAGFITTLPLVTFAIVSPFVSTLSSKIGHAKTMFIGLLFILVGEVCCSYTGIVGLFTGTVLLGVGIAIGNVIIPAIIKLHFSDKVGIVTSIYTTGMSQSAGYLFAALGSIVTGFIYDIKSTWSIPIIIFIGGIAFLSLCGFFAGYSTVGEYNRIESLDTLSTKNNSSKEIML